MNLTELHFIFLIFFLNLIEAVVELPVCHSTGPQNPSLDKDVLRDLRRDLKTISPN